MIEYKKAQKILLNSKIKIQNELIFAKNSLNRVSAKNIFSPTNYPAGNNTAFDGYAVNSRETIGLNYKNKKKFKILKTIAAGDNPKLKNVKKYCSVEIMTGALIPKYFDTIIPVEKINYYPNKKNPKFIVIDKKISKNNHVRFAGSDYKKGEKIVSAGEVINSSHILAFKSLGVERIVVKKKPVIVFYSTGNEISGKANIPDWKVRNSNSLYIKSLSKNLFFDFVDGGILRDNHDKLFKKLIIKNFKLSNYFKGVAIRPGKPIMFAKFKNKNQSFFGLPGNPISSAACFKFFVYPYLRSILNMKHERPFKAKLRKSYLKKKNFTRFLKGKILFSKKGIAEFQIHKGQESFRIKPFTKSNSWGLFPNGKDKFKKGDFIECFTLTGIN